MNLYTFFAMTNLPANPPATSQPHQTGDASTVTPVVVPTQATRRVIYDNLSRRFTRRVPGARAMIPMTEVVVKGGAK